VKYFFDFSISNRRWEFEQSQGFGLKAIQSTVCLKRYGSNSLILIAIVIRKGGL
jgi:hypothetical protein